MTVVARIPALAVVALALLQACAGVGPVGTPEDIVKRRAQERLDLLISGEVEKSFAFTSRGYQRSFGFAHYEKEFAGASGWLSAQVSDVVCGVDACDVKYWLTYRLYAPAGQPGTNTRGMQEKWIRADDGWVLYVDR